MGHRRHGGGLHQGCWMFAGAGNARGPGTPGPRRRRHGWLPVRLPCFQGRRGKFRSRVRPPAPNRGLAAQHVLLGARRPPPAFVGSAVRRHGRTDRRPAVPLGVWAQWPASAAHCGDGCQQSGGGGDGFPRVDRNALGIGGITVDYGQPGIEGRAAPCVGAPVDGDGKDGARRWIEPLKGAVPGAIARDAAGRRDRHQPPARREHGEGGTDVAQIRVMADTLDPGGSTKTAGSSTRRWDAGRADSCRWPRRCGG